MDYEVIRPLAGRVGPGTFDTFWDIEKYKDMATAIAENDLIIANFVQAEGLIYFEVYHTHKLEDKRYVRLDIQNFPFGVDILDELALEAVVETIIKEHRK